MKLHVVILSLIAGAGMFNATAVGNSAFEQMHVDQFDKIVRDGARAYADKDFAQAFPLLKRAACAGDKASQAMTGAMYVLGQGVARDTLTGYAWIRTAAELSGGDYTQLAHRLEQAMPFDQRELANAKAKTFVATYGVNATRMLCVRRTTLGSLVTNAVSCTPDGGGVFASVRRCSDLPALN